MTEAKQKIMNGGLKMQLIWRMCIQEGANEMT